MSGKPSWFSVADITGLSDAEILARVRLDGRVLPSLASCPPYLAQDELKLVLESVYIPSAQTLAVIRKALGMIEFHYRHHYASQIDYRTRISSLTNPLDPVMPMCLTGLPGVGKTKVISALMRLLDKEIVVDLGPGYQPATFLLGRYVKASSASSLLGILKDLIFGHGKAEGALKLDELRRIGGKKLYRDGCGCVGLDEMQMIARGANAVATIIKLLHTCVELGVPQIQASNFLNVAKIMGSGNEIADRLVAKCIVMTPEPASDPAELDLRMTYEDVTRGVVPKDDAFWSVLDELSFRIHRTRVALLGIAFEITRMQHRHRITREDLLVAAQTASFAKDMRKVSVLNQMAISGKPVVGHADLVCPLGLKLAFPEDAQRQAKTVAHREIEEEAVRSSMTPQEHRGLKAMQGASSDVPKKCRVRKAPKATYESLVASAASAK